MTTTFKWASPEAIASALTTELNSLANAAYTAVSSAIANETDLYEYLSVWLHLASLTPSGTPACSLYLLKSLDGGTTYEDGGGSVAPPNTSLIGVFDLSTSAGAKERVLANIPIPPLNFKLVLLNSSGVSLAASGNTVKYRRTNEQSV